MMLAWKISKTKKRLFENIWDIPCLLLAMMGLSGVLVCAMRLTSLSWNFSIISASIPVVSMPFKEDLDTDFKGHKDKDYVLDSKTIAIALTERGFYFGELAAFSKNLPVVNDKFFVPHRDEAPDMGALIENLRIWISTRKKQEAVKDENLAVLVVGEKWPVAVVIQIIYYLKDSKLFDRVVLSGGMV